MSKAAKAKFVEIKGSKTNTGVRYSIITDKKAALFLSIENSDPNGMYFEQDIEVTSLDRENIISMLKKVIK